MKNYQTNIVATNCCENCPITEHDQMEKEFQKEVKKSNAWSALYCIIALLITFVLTVIGSIKEMVTVDFTAGLIFLIIFTVVHIFSFYWIIKGIIHGWSE